MIARIEKGKEEDFVELGHGEISIRKGNPLLISRTSP
jgi:hypothetical protein